MSQIDVRGETTTALAFAQGRETARAHGRRLESDRRFVEARSGEPFDELARRSMLETTARLAFDRLEPDAGAFVAAYAEGVDAGLRPGDRSRGRWQPWTPMAVFSLHHVLFGTLGHHLWRRHVARTLGPAAVIALGQEASAVAGSNAWVVGGGRTASGLPLIGADPHRILSVPGVYQKVRLRTPDLDVVGLTIPGVPGVQHFGHTGGVAWAITNAMADAQDAVDVLLRGSGDGDDEVEADLGLGWEPCDADGDVIVTRLGPVVVVGPEEGSGIVLRGAPWVARDLGFGALLPLLEARTADDVCAALDAWVDPVNDVLVADTTGAVRRRVAGLVPHRVDGDWLGWVEHDVESIPADGIAVVANHRPASARKFDTEFVPPHRALRMAELLEDATAPPGEGLTVEDGLAVHADTLLPPAAQWQDRLRGVTPSSDEAEAVRVRVLAWDRHMDTDSRGAAAFAAVRHAVVRRLADHPELAPLRASSGLPDLFAPWLAVEPRIALALDRWMHEGAPFGIDLDAVLSAALDEVAEVGHPPTWGATHVFRPEEGDPVPLAGDDHCVLSTTSLPGVTDDVWRGPVARLVWSLADRSESRWTVPDETDVWASGGALPLEDA